jgi:hypothetical protein
VGAGDADALPLTAGELVALAESAGEEGAPAVREGGDEGVDTSVGGGSVEAFVVDGGTGTDTCNFTPANQGTVTSCDQGSGH